MGHVINKYGIAPDPAKLRVLAIWPIPETVRAVQSFRGFVNWYGDFIPDTTRLTAPLYALAAGRKGTEKLPSAQRSSPVSTPSSRLYALAPS